MNSMQAMAFGSMGRLQPLPATVAWSHRGGVGHQVLGSWVFDGRCSTNFLIKLILNSYLSYFIII